MSALSPAAVSLRTAAVMAAFALAFTALMAGAYLLTRPRIEHSAEQEKLRLIDEVLPRSAYDNALLDDVLVLAATPELGLPAGGHVWRARKAGAPVALVLEAATPEGYSGRIGLVVAVLADGSVGGVRVTAHRETPGLGDYIDPAKDKNKARPWIGQFAGQSLDRLSLPRWQVRKDGGDFDYMTGATVSARAVTRAVARTVDYARAHRDQLFAAPTPGAQP
ncbi:MAG: electron transport complex subunit RsxG [Rhodocyclaceae bacterium]